MRQECYPLNCDVQLANKEWKDFNISSFHEPKKTDVKIYHRNENFYCRTLIGIIWWRTFQNFGIQ
jgi:hypothetical protein